MAIDCSSGDPAQWAHIASLGAQVDDEYAPYTLTSFREISGRYVWLFDATAEDPCNAIEDHFFDTSFTLNEAEQTKFDEEALVFVGRESDGAQANDCFCCPLALVTSSEPIQLGAVDHDSSCYTNLDFSDPCNGENAILSQTILNFFATFGNRTKRRRSQEEEIDGERLLVTTMTLCEDSDQRMRICLIWMEDEDCYALRRVEIDLAGQLAFLIKADDMTRLYDAIATKFRTRCSNTDTRWKTLAGIEIPTSCYLSLGALICTMFEEDEFEDEAGCIECSGSGTEDDPYSVMLPWEESTCSGTECGSALRMYCATLKQLEQIVDEVIDNDDDLKDDSPTSNTDCIECCLEYSDVELRFEFSHGCNCAKFHVYYSKLDADDEVIGEEQDFGEIDISCDANPGSCSPMIDTITGWKEIVAEGETFKTLKFRFTCSNKNFSSCSGFDDGEGNRCHNGATGRFRVKGVLATTTVQVSTDQEPEIDFCALISNPAP